MNKKKIGKRPSTSRSRSSADEKAEFVLRLNGKIVPWAFVVLFFILLGRALIAEYRIYQTEQAVEDHENRVRTMEKRPRLPNESWELSK